MVIPLFIPSPSILILPVPCGSRLIFLLLTLTILNWFVSIFPPNCGVVSSNTLDNPPTPDNEDHLVWPFPSVMRTWLFDPSVLGSLKLTVFDDQFCSLCCGIDNTSSIEKRF